MNESPRYMKVVAWSEEDQCFVGSCPGLFYGGCHGDDEKRVFAELCEIAEEMVDLYKQDGKPLPPAKTSDYLMAALERSTRAIEQSMLPPAKPIEQSIQSPAPKATGQETPGAMKVA